MCPAICTLYNAHVVHHAPLLVQQAPLDLFTSEFFVRRKELIETRLDWLRGTGTEVCVWEVWRCVGEWRGGQWYVGGGEGNGVWEEGWQWYVGGGEGRGVGGGEGRGVCRGRRGVGGGQ